MVGLYSRTGRPERSVLRTRIPQVVTLSILGLLVHSAAVGGHAWRDAAGRIYHEADQGGEAFLVYGDWMGNEDFRGAFRNRVTDFAPTAWEWSPAIDNATTGSSADRCTWPNPQLQPRLGLYDVCVGEYAAWWNARNLPPNTLGENWKLEIDYRDGQAHVTRQRVLIDAGRNNTLAHRLWVMCHEIGHTYGLGHLPPASGSCMEDPGNMAVNIGGQHDCDLLADIYLNHNDGWEV